jgi:signal transduction histidine kinase
VTFVDAAGSTPTGAVLWNRRALGRLSAGLSHEINSPIQFIGDNARFLATACEDLLALVRSYAEVLVSADGVDDELRARLRASEEEYELDYLQGEVPAATQHMLDGIQRVSDVVRALRILSHPGHDGPEPADVNELLEAAVLVSRHAIDDVAVLHVDLGELPPVRCDVAWLAEAFRVLILDAVEAMERADGRGGMWVSTRQEGNDAVIELAHTSGDADRGSPRSGPGVPVTRLIVEEWHDGTVAWEAGRSVGRRISVRLPIDGGLHPSR